ncbi:MAG: HDOD domain-containing protein [Bdellovibrionales bacterium]|nr:HDOD domain-containing protein [Bdellovibrionales bacterium]
MTEARPQEFEGRLAQGKDWREIVAWVGDLPPMPQVAAKAIVMVEDPDTTAQKLTDLLSNDTALAARVLKIANSAMFSRQREITTLNQAVMVIGFKALKGIIVAATLRQLNKKFGKLEKMVWENSMCTAMGATLLCRKLKRPYHEEVFLLGLLHSLGQIVFLTQDDTSKDYKLVLSKIQSEGLRYNEAEQETFGFAHPLIGALVAKKWNFSADTCQVILHYCDPVDGAKPDGELEEKIALVQLADLISHAAGIGTPEGYPDGQEAIGKLIDYLGFEAPNKEEFVQEVLTQTREMFEAEGAIYS